MGKVRFWEAKFQGWVTIRACEFDGEADLRSLHAEQGFVVTGCTFRASFLFRGSTVEKKFEADDALEGLTDFSKVKFHDFAYLENIVQGATRRFRSPTPWPSAFRPARTTRRPHRQREVGRSFASHAGVWSSQACF